MEYHGITGEMHFDMSGFRTDVRLELLEKQRDHLVKTGIWTPEIGINYTRTAAEGEAQIVEKLQNKTLRVTTVTVIMLKKLKQTNKIQSYYIIFNIQR